jgi:hypothetical protein
MSSCCPTTKYGLERRLLAMRRNSLARSVRDDDGWVPLRREERTREEREEMVVVTRNANYQTNSLYYTLYISLLPHPSVKSHEHTRILVSCSGRGFITTPYATEPGESRS